ncbi:MAG: 3-hydroxybutyryl-CoA dehydrogenase [Colwellia sp.]|nr:3-hydroxybutyryl-CoA dehydrogenase [Colwellia sp.]
MDRVAIVGNGVMAQGIASVCIIHGYEVSIISRSELNIQSSRNNILRMSKKVVAKNKMDVCSDDLVNKLSFSCSFEDISNCGIIIESVTEDLMVKQKVLKSIEQYRCVDSIVATNTSSISITELASYSKTPESFIGLHFFNPAPVMALTEIVKGMLTSDECIDKTFKFATSLEKSPVIVEDSPGFVVNRLLIPMINEAINALSEGVASALDIDSAMKLGANHPIGPLSLADLIGNDVCLSILDSLHQETGDQKYRASPLLRKMVRANVLGRKTKKGFFNY